MPDIDSFEKKVWKNYLAATKDEIILSSAAEFIDDEYSLIVTEGFEERSLGVIKKLADSGKKLSTVILGRYSSEKTCNHKFRTEFEMCAGILATGRWGHVVNNNDGEWLRNALDLVNTKKIILDITGLSNRGLFRVLDIATDTEKEIFIAYSEAKSYWPKDTVWKQLSKAIQDPTKLSEVVDRQPWLFGSEHSVEIISNHEGYDSAGAGRALVAFLPFKCARLAAILSEEDYAECVYIAGKPRLASNQWRLECLKKINEPIIKNQSVAQFDTFGYRKTLQNLGEIFFSQDALITKYDVHLAILGSKLQSVACWMFSHIVPSITCVTSIPMTYYDESFSEGVGCSWVIQLKSPKRIC